MSEIVAQINSKMLMKSIGFLSFTFILLLAMPFDSHGAGIRRENAVVNAVKKASPAVVNISSEYEVRKRTNPFSGYGMDPLFESFFKDFFDPGFEQRSKRSSLGSGVIIDGKRGFILTNTHVIAKSGTITVVLKDQREFKAQIVGADQESDLALLRIVSEEPLPAIKMGESSDLMIGETVIAIGNPFGFSNTVTTGVISALNRSVRTDKHVFQNFIQTDASINPGNSGGPLLNINGELIAINTAIYAKAQGIGFAIPINKAKRIVSDLIQYGKVIQAWIGITVQNIDTRLAKYLNIPDVRGVLITEIITKGPAQKAGIQHGDILLSIGSKKIFSKKDYNTEMRNVATGDAIKIRILRKDKELIFMVKTAVFPIELAMDLAHKLLGIKVKDRSMKKGVVISEINRRSYLFQIGVRTGDVIRQLDEIRITDVKDFQKAIVQYRQKRSVVILLQRGDQGYYITVKL